MDLLAFRAVAEQMGTLYYMGNLACASSSSRAFQLHFFWDTDTHLWRIKVFRAGISGREAFPHGRLGTAGTEWWQRSTKSH